MIESNILMDRCDVCGGYGCDCYAILGRCNECDALLNIGDFDNGQCMSCGNLDIVEAVIGDI